MQITVIPYNVIDRTELPLVWLDKIPENGESLEIASMKYYVCGTEYHGKGGLTTIKVIPCVIRYNSKGWAFGSYFDSLASALSRMEHL